MYKPPENKKPVHLCKHLHKVPVKKRIFPCIGDVKYDGVYAYQILRKGDYRIFSRTGMQYKSLEHIELAGARLVASGIEEQVLIFEVHHSDYPVNTISGHCRDTKEQFPELYGVVHDIIPYEDFIEGLCIILYIKRKRKALDVIKPEGYKVYKESLSFHIRDEEHAQMLFKQWTDADEEGIIGRDPNGIWIAGKKNELCWKIKIELSYDLRVTGVEEGNGKYKGMTGKLLCFFRLFGKKDGIECTVKCSGMSDKQRYLWWEHRFDNGHIDDIINKIVKVDAMTFTINGLLREPRFKEVREDKVEADF